MCGYVARIAGNLVVKLLGTPRRWANNIEMHFREMGYEDED